MSIIIYSTLIIFFFNGKVVYIKLLCGSYTYDITIYMVSKYYYQSLLLNKIFS